jgi:hypothetical protein
LGQAIAQPIQQLLLTTPLLTKQWTDTAQSAPQYQMNLIKNSKILKINPYHKMR